MAVPTVTALSPEVGPAGGRNLVVITGTNFRLVEVEPGTVRTPLDVNPTVRVLFGTEPARRVDVISETRLEVEAPAFFGTPAAGNTLDIATVDVTVTNLADDGTPIPGETVAFDGYGYQRSPIRSPGLGEAPYADVVREVVLLFRRQVLDNASITTNVDFAADGAAVTLLATRPALILVGPRLRENRVWRSNEFIDVADVDGADRFQPHEVVDLLFDVTGATDNLAELFALMGTVKELFMRTPWVEPGVPGARDRLPFELTSEPSITPTPTDSRKANLHLFEAGFEVRAVPIRLAERTFRVDEVDEIQASVQTGLDPSEGPLPEVLLE